MSQLAALGYFYIKSTASPSGVAALLTPATQNLVIDVERGGFLSSWTSPKEGAKTIIATQKNDKEHDATQLWKYNDGWIINKQSGFCLEVDNGN
jgi:hypothetical protein